MVEAMTVEYGDLTIIRRGGSTIVPEWIHNLKRSDKLFGKDGMTLGDADIPYATNNNSLPIIPDDVIEGARVPDLNIYDGAFLLFQACNEDGELIDPCTRIGTLNVFQTVEGNTGLLVCGIFPDSQTVRRVEFWNPDRGFEKARNPFVLPIMITTSRPVDYQHKDYTPSIAHTVSSVAKAVSKMLDGIGKCIRLAALEPSEPGTYRRQNATLPYFHRLRTTDDKHWVVSTDMNKPVTFGEAVKDLDIDTDFPLVKVGRHAES